jgi:hypothetical protein
MGTPHLRLPGFRCDVLAQCGSWAMLLDCSQIMWAPFSRNVVPGARIFSANVVPKPPM